MIGSMYVGYEYNEVGLFVFQEYFMDNDLNRTHCLQYRYTLLHPLSCAEMSQVAGVLANCEFDCSSPSYPVVAWQTGVIRLHGPVTFGLLCSEEGKFLQQFVNRVLVHHKDIETHFVLYTFNTMYICMKLLKITYY